MVMATASPISSSSRPLPLPRPSPLSSCRCARPRQAIRLRHSAALSPVPQLPAHARSRTPPPDGWLRPRRGAVVRLACRRKWRSLAGRAHAWACGSRMGTFTGVEVACPDRDGRRVRRRRRVGLVPSRALLRAEARRDLPRTGPPQGSKGGPWHPEHRGRSPRTGPVRTIRLRLVDLRPGVAPSAYPDGSVGAKGSSAERVDARVVRHRPASRSRRRPRAQVHHAPLSLTATARVVHVLARLQIRTYRPPRRTVHTPHPGPPRAAQPS